MESIELQADLDGIKEEKERLLNSLVEAEYVFNIFISEKDSHFVVYEFYSCIVIHIYSCISIAFQAPDHVMGEENSACPWNKGCCWLRSWSGWDQGHECRDSQDAGQIHSADEAAREDDTRNGESSIKVTFSHFTMFWLTSSKHEQNYLQENVTVYRYWYNDINGILYRRDTIVTRGDAQQKMNKKVLTKGTFERQMGELRKKIKVTIQVRDGNSI